MLKPGLGILSCLCEQKLELLCCKANCQSMSDFGLIATDFSVALQWCFSTTSSSRWLQSSDFSKWLDCALVHETRTSRCTKISWPKDSCISSFSNTTLWKKTKTLHVYDGQRSTVLAIGNNRVSLQQQLTSAVLAAWFRQHWVDISAAAVRYACRNAPQEQETL